MQLANQASKVTFCSGVNGPDIVILSPIFFQKSYTQHELELLLQLDLEDSKNRILPILVDMDFKEISKKNLSLSTRHILKWENELDNILNAIKKRMEDYD